MGRDPRKKGRQAGHPSRRCSSACTHSKTAISSAQTLPGQIHSHRTLPPSGPASLGLSDFFQVDMLGMRYTSVNFRAEKSPRSPNCFAQKDRDRPWGSARGGSPWRSASSAGPCTPRPPAAASTCPPAVSAVIFVPVYQQMRFRLLRRVLVHQQAAVSRPKKSSACHAHAAASTCPPTRDDKPPRRQPRDKTMICLVNSHTHATPKR